MSPYRRTSGLLFVGFLVGFSISAQEPEVDLNQPSKIHPLGFLGFGKGGFYVSGIAGPTGIKGSLIDHERTYDTSLKAQILYNQVPVKVGSVGFPQTHVPISVQKSSISIAQLEYAVNDYIGVGISNISTNVLVDRQAQTIVPEVTFKPGSVTQIDEIRLKPGAAPYYDRQTLIKAWGPHLVVQFHPLSRNMFDPYIGFRAGIQNGISNARASAGPDPSVLFDRAKRISGQSGNLQLGVNFSPLPLFSVNVEGGSQRAVFKAEGISGRGLTQNYLLVGLRIHIHHFVVLDDSGEFEHSWPAN